MKQRQSAGMRIISLILVFVLGFSLLPSMQTKAEASFDINAVLDSTELYPQKTGYAALDALLEEILAPYEDASTSKKVQICYEWTVRNIDYSWDGYTKSGAGYDGFKEKYPYDDYEEGLQKAFPEEIIDRTYYTMSEHKGVCYDWGAVFAVMMRYIGLEAYVHTGMFRFEWETQIGHHGWAEVQIDGVNYIFDPQREYRMCNDGTGTISYTRYYGLRYSDTDRYAQETEINAKRDAGFLPVTAHREKLVQITGIASRSGKVSGSGQYDVGTTAVLTAVSPSDRAFLGWYDVVGNLLCDSTEYSFTVTEAATVYAMFEGDRYYDISADAWYLDYAMRVAQEEIMTGTAPFRFDANISLTRAMVVQMIAKMEGADLSGYTETKFTDVPSGKWYTAAVAWAVDNGVAAGVSETSFAPNSAITREEFLTMFVSYMKGKGIAPEAAAWDELTYTDKDSIQEWARDAVCRAVTAKLIAGYPDGSLRPKNKLIRAEGAVIFCGAMDCMAK